VACALAERPARLAAAMRRATAGRRTRTGIERRVGVKIGRVGPCRSLSHGAFDVILLG
jgi:hypothetical protein